MHIIIDTTVLSDRTRIQLEDWHSENSNRYPDLYGYVIAAYPRAKKSNDWIKAGDKFRLSISRNEYAKYTDNMVLTDYEALKKRTKKLTDLREHFDNGVKDQFSLGLINKELY